MFSTRAGLGTNTCWLKSRIVNLSEIVTVALFLTALGIVPILLMGIVSRRRPTDSGLQECAHCGAYNRKTKERCYCCGLRFVLPQSDRPDPALIQRVKQADASRMRREAETHTLRVVEDEPERAEKASEP